MSLPHGRAGTSGEPPAWTHIVESIGPKVHQVRQQLGLSLQQLAARSEVSAAAIHKVERGDMVPTITTLLKLAGALGRPVTFFVDEGAPATPVASVRRADERAPAPPGWADAGVTATALAVPTERLRAGAVLAVLAPGATRAPAEQPAGEQLLLVEQGELAVDVAGEQYLLRPGDTLHHPTDRPHRWHNPGTTATHVLAWYKHD